MFLLLARQLVVLRQTARDVEIASAAFPHILYFDGGARGNPGQGGCGAVIEENVDGQRRTIFEGYAFLEDPKTTNNVAEYCGLLLGAKALQDHGISKCLICGDSKLVINQLDGTWRCRDEKLSVLRQRAVDSLRDVEYSVLHIARDLNGKADRLANLAMDTRQSSRRKNNSRTLGVLIDLRDRIDAEIARLEAED